MLLRFFLFAVLFAINPYGCKKSSTSTSSSSSVSPEQIEVIASIVRGHYAVPVPGAEQKFPPMIIDSQILSDFAVQLYTANQQTSRELFLDLVKDPSSPLLHAYVVQEFAVMTNLFEKTLVKMTKGTDVPLRIIQ